jgi:F-type H+-transporting ATPase subunit delta
MIKAESLPKVYARALLEAARDAGILDQVVEEAAAFRAILEREPDVGLFIENPKIELAAKRGALERALRGRTSDLFVDFLLLVIDKGRQLQLRQMLEELEKLHDQILGRVKALAVTAVPLDEAVLAQLRERVAARLRKQVLLINKPDPAILGGLILRFDGMVADGSLRTALEQNRARLLSKKFGSEFIHENQP